MRTCDDFGSDDCDGIGIFPRGEDRWYCGPCAVRFDNHEPEPDTFDEALAKLADRGW